MSTHDQLVVAASQLVERASQSPDALEIMLAELSVTAATDSSALRALRVATAGFLQALKASLAERCP